MSICPEFRIRLFLTVDLVGSTAFKSKAATNGAQLYPEWVRRFRDFYRQFPEILDASYRETKSGKSSVGNGLSGPKLWKIIGDEILFCCRVNNLQHLACCVSAFISSLEQYGSSLSGVNLDAKGAGWIAAFPAKNISLSIAGGAISFELPNEDLVTEAFEAGADEDPQNFDFLGSSIDTGFRVAKYAQADKFAASAELAVMLAEAKERQMFMREFRYDGRQELKGVNGDQPYPVVYVDTERDAGKREVRTRERLVTKEMDVTALALRDFLNSYLSYHGFDLPKLPLNGDDTTIHWPPSYEQYRAQWQTDLKDAQRQDESISAAEASAEDAAGDGVGALVTEFARHMRVEAVRHFRSKAIDTSAEDAFRDHLLDPQRQEVVKQRVRERMRRQARRSRGKSDPESKE